jgi:hypothetical protein
VRLGPNQLPELYGNLPPICQILGIHESEFSLEMAPVPNAYTYGDTQAFLTVTLLVFWPVFITQIWGVVQQAKLDEEALATIEASLKERAGTPQRKSGFAATEPRQFCTNCGDPLPVNARFCPGCGAAIT